MHDVLTSANHRDFRQRYQGSYGWYITEQKKRILVNMTSIGAERVSFIDSLGNAYQAFADQGVEFEFIPVEKRLFMMGAYLCFTERVPARMWSKGIHSDNTLMYNLSTGSKMRVSFSTVDSSTKPLPPVFMDDTSVALSEVFGVSSNKLFAYNNHIGGVRRARKEFVLSSKLFSQEMEDLVEKHALQYTIVIEEKEE